LETLRFQKISLCLFPLNIGYATAQTFSGDTAVDMAEIRNIVLEKAQLPIDVQQVSDTTDLDDAGITSLGRMTVILALEDRLQITFPDEIMMRENFSSITAISKTVDALLSKVYRAAVAYIPLDWLDLFTTSSTLA
jgi:acyl carrier protein